VKKERGLESFFKKAIILTIYYFFHMDIYYITCESKKQAKSIATALLKNRLIACANYFPINSLYWWGSKIGESMEYVLVVQTKMGMFKKIEKEVKNNHSYDLVCIAKIPVEETTKEYLKWLDEEVL
jgi:periplasmic divalent cation tolerance protein